jgi:hypothetical protein
VNECKPLGSGGSPSTAKFNMKNPAIKRIMQEMKEMQAGAATCRAVPFFSSERL